MSKSALEELLEERDSDELPRISNLEEEPDSGAPSSNKNEQNEILVVSSDDEIIEISSEEQLPSSSTFAKAENNNRKAGFKADLKKKLETLHFEPSKVYTIEIFETIYFKTL